MSSLQEVSDRLGEQNDLILEIGTDLYSYLDKITPQLSMQSTLLRNLKGSNDRFIGELRDQEKRSFGKDLEKQREAGQYNTLSLGHLKSIDESMKKLAGTGVAPSPESKGPGIGKQFAGALMGGLGAGLKIFSGLASLGFGIGGFFTGLALGDKAQALIDTDMTATKKNMITLGEAFSQTPIEGLVAMGALAAVGAKFGSMKGAMNMTFFGAGLGGFFTGLALGDKAGALLNIDGSALATIMGSVATGLNQFDDTSLLALGGIIGMSKLLGVSSAVLLPAMGVGLAGFFGAFAGIGDILGKIGVNGEGLRELLKNTALGLAHLNEIDGLNLLAVGGGMVAVGAGMAAIMGADWVKGIGDFIGGLFGRDEEDDIFAKTARSLNKLNDVDVDVDRLKGLGEVGETFSKLAGALQILDDTDMDDIKERLHDLGETVAYAIPLFDVMDKGGTIGEGVIDGYSEMNFVDREGNPMGLRDVSTESIEKMKTAVSFTTPEPTKGTELTAETTQMQIAQSAPPAPTVINAPSTTTNNQGGSTAMIQSSIVAVDPFTSGTSNA